MEYEVEVEAAGGAASDDAEAAADEADAEADVADAEAAADEADVADVEAALPETAAPDDAPDEPADADALADELDTSAVCSFGSTGWNTNLGTTYNAKTAARANAPAAIKISGSFDFFFSAAGLEPPPEEA